MTFLQFLFYFLHWLVLKTWHLISLCVLWFWPSAGISWNVIGGNSLRPEVKLSSSQENCFLLPIAWGATTQHFLNQIVCLKFSLIFVLFVCFLLKVKGFPTSCASRWQTSTVVNYRRLFYTQRQSPDRQVTLPISQGGFVCYSPLFWMELFACNSLGIQAWCKIFLEDFDLESAQSCGSCTQHRCQK